MKLYLALSFVLLLGACTSAGSSGSKSPGDVREELLDVDRSFSAYAQSHSLPEAFRAFLAEDATSMPIGKPFVHGRDAIVASLMTIQPGERLVWAPRAAEASAGGDLGYTYGAWELTIPAPGGAPLVRRGQYVTIWRHQKDGTWKAVFDGGNTLDG